MYYGPRHGYVRFGTNNHKVLMLMLGQAHVSHRSLRVEFEAHYPDTPNLDAVIGNALSILRRNGFIYYVGRDRDDFGRAYALFSLDPLPPEKRVLTVPKMDGQARCRKYRERKRLKVNSVFNFRTKIPLNPGDTRGANT